MKNRSVELVANAGAIHSVGDGFRVHTFFPSSYRLDMYRMSPFILLDYNPKIHFAPSQTPRGVGVHPHRGFETVTIAYKGKVQHHDSSGGGGVIEEGDVQWMTAASGVLHKEYHEEEWSKKGGDFQMVQLWVNLPAKDKMSAPKYQALKSAEINKYKIDDAGSEIGVIAGDFNGVKGSAVTFSPVNLLNIKLKSGTELPLSFPEKFNTALLVIEGEVLVNGTEKVLADSLALMANDGEGFKIKAVNDSVVLVLSGEPINEPLVAHGPFVMNTKQEIIQAFQDFENGKFGYLED
ncbi:MAG: short-chain dehydrogenase [Bacteroidetes bacterium 37-13]|nr:MAG: short-chain dehydrogenase [Bacteroidetes bacterium 37-13]